MNPHLVEQLLSCSVCLERYTRPKLLPCQHTFCQEPCLSSLVDQDAREVKCPECRGLHAIPREGVAGFPSNRTILGFLDISMGQISGQINIGLTCGSCGLEKELGTCHHCQNQLCNSCHRIHMERVRWDLRSLVSQLRRSIPKLSDALRSLEQRSASVRENGESVRAKIRHSTERHMAELKEREQALLLEVESMIWSSGRTLRSKQEDLELGLATVSSHCDCVNSSLAKNSSLPSTKLWQLYQQSKELIDQVRQLEKPQQERPQILTFVPSTDIYNNGINFGTVTWVIKDFTPSPIISSPLSSGQVVQRSYPRITSTPNSTEMYPPLPLINSSSLLLKAPTNIVTSRPQLGQRPNTLCPTDTPTLVIEPQDICNNLAGFRLTGRSLLLHYQEKGCMKRKIGSKGSDVGHFTWPRGVAATLEGELVVADSSNHRVQVFDRRGRFLRSFGSYGSAVGEFDCLAGVAVSNQGWIVTADRYNHRLQLFHSSGRFVRDFGREGSGDGQLSYPWGVAVDQLGLIYVCDKDNNRIQLFTPGGQFVRKFGCRGAGDGQLDQPHYVAVGPLNRVVVSDSGNHRIQIFDTSGRFLGKFGSEGTALGQFKYPRGVALDHEGNILVGDSGNNRVQLFQPDGTFLQAFGSWGTGNGQVKGLEGVAFCEGDIIVSDRENHRIQTF
ncbi:RING finger protein nhl-1-like [Scyliorhinus canicula]|uniref:RING finger protein nhl-1-like n=1 Tax=Scyliorhinus canicula TaxID=7830 RepID=UPI0018F3B7F4|nr:RING finger protein nhl-1-like [Scyliorhinus canicula]